MELTELYREAYVDEYFVENHALPIESEVFKSEWGGLQRLDTVAEYCQQQSAD